jgi:hypothetical protein
MTKYYSVAISDLDPEQEKQLAEKWRHHGWWHAIPDFWLLKDRKNETTAGMLRDQVKQIAPMARIMVVEMTPITWAGTSMTESNREWLKKFWPPEGEK